MLFVCNAGDRSVFSNTPYELCIRFAKISSGYDDARYVVPDEIHRQSAFLIGDNFDVGVREVPALRARFFISDRTSNGFLLFFSPTSMFVSVLVNISGCCIDSLTSLLAIMSLVPSDSGLECGLRWFEPVLGLLH